MRNLIILFLFFFLLQNLYGQKYLSMDAVLKKEFPENSTKDGRWVYYPEKANIEKIEYPLIKDLLPNFEFYKMTLTNYLGYHVNEGDCVVLFDSLKSKIILVQPIWYSGISESLIKLFLNKQFESKEKLLSILDELNKILEIGSGYRFIFKSFSDTLITYDLVYFKGDSYTTDGNGISNTVNYTQDGVWRQIEIKISDLKILEYVSLNPRLKDDKENKKYYKEVIR